jgi:hypothetical protein
LAEGRRSPLAFTVSFNYHKRLIYRNPPFHLPIKTQSLINIYFSLKKLSV